MRDRCSESEQEIRCECKVGTMHLFMDSTKKNCINKTNKQFKIEIVLTIYDHFEVNRIIQVAM